jgi:peptidyl-prolyl cis-trans isomerase D
MLRAFRRVRNSWIVVGLLGFIMLAFVITGVGTGGKGGMGQMGMGPEHVAIIGGESLTTVEAKERLNRVLDAARQEQPGLDMATFIRTGAFDELLKELITSKVILAFGTAQGFSASKRQIDGEIASIPAFRNAAGKFDRQTFDMALANAKTTEQQLRDDFRLQIIQKQVIVPVAINPKIPEAFARQYAALLVEARTGSIGLVPTRALGAGTPPTDAEVAAYFKKNVARYTIPERRVIRYAAFGLADVAAAATPTEGEIQAFYKANSASYAPRETRTLSQVILPDQKTAQAFAAKVAGGKSFSQAASENGFAAGDIALGSLTRQQMAGLATQAVADAAFAASKGSITAPIKSALGWHILKVDEITVIPGRPLEAVRGTIVQGLSQQKAAAALSDLSSKIEDAIGNGSSFDEAAKANGLKIVETPAVTSTGTNPDVPGFQLPDETKPLLKAAFELAPDDDPVVETIQPNNRYAIVSTGHIVPAAPPPLAKIADRVRADFTWSRAEIRAKALAEKLVAQIDKGTSIRDAFAKAGVTLPPVQTTTARRMDIAQAGDRVPPPLKAIFSLSRGKSKIIPAPNAQGWFIVHLDQIIAGDIDKTPGLVDATRSQFTQIVGDEYAEQFAHAAEGVVNVRRHESVIARLKKDLGSREGSVE